MAKTKRANHRGGSERPRLAPNGTADDAEQADWQPDEERPHVVAEPQPINGQTHTVAENDGAPSAFGTPVQVDEIALATMALSDDLVAATKGLPESVESRQFRRDLDEAAATFRAIAAELGNTAGGLIRLAAHAGETCSVAWGICPEHDITLLEVGEVTTCRVLGCYHEPEEPVERCQLPVAYRVVDAGGPALLACAGHAVACRLHLENAVITLASDSLELL